MTPELLPVLFVFIVLPLLQHLVQVLRRPRTPECAEHLMTVLGPCRGPQSRELAAKTRGACTGPDHPFGSRSTGEW
jgi:hypothetical protein